MGHKPIKQSKPEKGRRSPPTRMVETLNRASEKGIHFRAFLGPRQTSVGEQPSRCMAAAPVTCGQEIEVPESIWYLALLVSLVWIEDLGTANQVAKVLTNGTTVNRILPCFAESNSCLWIREISMVMNECYSRGREKAGSSTELKRHYDTDSVFRENADAAVCSEIT
ncbi:hypothetical protein ACFX1Q_041812 [Malus domestica]